MAETQPGKRGGPGQNPDWQRQQSAASEAQRLQPDGGSGESPSDDRFHVDASVVFQLGESLVSDVVQALVELVKNAYDADASFVRIVVDTENFPPADLEIDAGSHSHAPSPGYILIEDDGTGMTRSVIRQGWLTISRSPKRTFKRELRVTPKGRTPLGDKGLGRLGVQRLGNRVHILTRATSGDVGEAGDERDITECCGSAE